jgi:hypothetical protein
VGESDEEVFYLIRYFFQSALPLENNIPSNLRSGPAQKKKFQNQSTTVLSEVEIATL